MVTWTVPCNRPLIIRWLRVLTVGAMTGCSCILLGAGMADLAHWSRPRHGLGTSAPSGEWIGSAVKVNDLTGRFAMSACCQDVELMARADATSPLASSAPSFSPTPGANCTSVPKRHDTICVGSSRKWRPPSTRGAGLLPAHVQWDTRSPHHRPHVPILGERPVIPGKYVTALDSGRVPLRENAD